MFTAIHHAWKNIHLPTNPTTPTWSTGKIAAVAADCTIGIILFPLTLGGLIYLGLEHRNAREAPKDDMNKNTKGQQEQPSNPNANGSFTPPSDLTSPVINQTPRQGEAQTEDPKGEKQEIPQTSANNIPKENTPENFQDENIPKNENEKTDNIKKEEPQTIDDVFNKIKKKYPDFCSTNNGIITIKQQITASEFDALKIPKGMWKNVQFDNVTLSATDINKIGLIKRNGRCKIPEYVTVINSEAFKGNTDLKSITIPEGVTTIGDYAFSGCEKLKKIELPNELKTIGDNTFAWCKNLTEITVPNSVTTIGNNAFCGCESLTSITVPNSVTTIGNSAFFGCKSLTSITVPNSVQTIGYSAFWGCAKLETIELQKSIETIQIYIFAYCYKLHTIICNGIDDVDKITLILSTLQTSYIDNCKLQFKNVDQQEVQKAIESANLPLKMVDGDYYRYNAEFNQQNL